MSPGPEVSFFWPPKPGYMRARRDHSKWYQRQFVRRARRKGHFPYIKGWKKRQAFRRLLRNQWHIF